MFTTNAVLRVLEFILRAFERAEARHLDKADEFNQASAFYRTKMREADRASTEQAHEADRAAAIQRKLADLLS